MARKPVGSDDNPANDEPARGGQRDAQKAPGIMAMTTSPAFDLWLDRQMKTLVAACDRTTDQALVDLIRRELSKRDGKVTE